MKIAFIGGGNMATALIKGLASPANQIRVADPSEAVRARLGKMSAVTCFERSADAAAGSEVVVLAVKPQVMPVVLKELTGQLASHQLVISVAAGITVSTLQAALGEKVQVVRAMPNTPALIGHGISGLYASPACSAHARDQAEQVLKAGGETVWLDDEHLMDVVTAVSGSGPAYFFLLTEALQKAGIELGLAPEVATRLALHTAYGAGAMALQADVPVGELRKRVTSPGGTTQAALEVLSGGGLEALLSRAVKAATDRGRELSAAGDAS